MILEGMQRLASAFRHRSGRAISLSRLILALVFFFAVWLDPTEPAAHAALCCLILLGYSVFAAVHLIITWVNWRLEYRMAVPAHFIDCAVFAVTVALTGGYASPFFSLSIFIVLSALIKWGWQAAAATGVAVMLLFFASGLFAMEMAGGSFELRRFIMRSSALLVLAGLIVWFGFSQTIARRLPAAEKAPDAPDDEARPVEAILQRVAQQLGARRTVFAWTEAEEPWTRVATLNDGTYREERYPPDRFASFTDPALEGGPFLFGRDAAVALDPIGGRLRFVATRNAVSPDLAQACGLDEGIGIPIDTCSHAGIVIATRINRLCTDDLTVAAALAAEAAAALRHAATLAVMEENAAAETRLGFARDLHDSVVQILAGTSLRVEAIRAAIASGGRAEADLEALQNDLAAEQKNLRLLIQQLRGDRVVVGPVDLCSSMAQTARRSGRHWGVRCVLDASPGPIEVSPRVEHELRHMLQEAIANSVRHGGAAYISVKLDRRGPDLVMDVEDDGGGCAAAGETAPAGMSKTLAERARSLGGTLTLEPREGGSRLTVAIPAEAAA